MEYDAEYGELKTKQTNKQTRKKRRVRLPKVQSISISGRPEFQAIKQKRDVRRPVLETNSTTINNGVPSKIERERERTGIQKAGN